MSSAENSRKFADNLIKLDPTRQKLDKMLADNGFNPDGSVQPKKREQARFRARAESKGELSAPTEPSPATQALPAVQPSTLEGQAQQALEFAQQATPGAISPLDNPLTNTVIDAIPGGRSLRRVPLVASQGVAKVAPRAVEFVQDIYNFWANKGNKDLATLGITSSNPIPVMTDTAVNTIDAFVDKATTSPENATENFISQAATLLAPIGAGTKALQAAGKLSSFMASSVSGVAGDLVLVDPDDPTMTEWLAGVDPTLQSDVKKAIKSDLPPQEIEQTLKAKLTRRLIGAAEGGVLGLGVDLIAKAVAFRAASRQIAEVASDVGRQEGLIDEATGTFRPPEQQELFPDLPAEQLELGFDQPGVVPPTRQEALVPSLDPANRDIILRGVQQGQSEGEIRRLLQEERGIDNVPPDLGQIIRNFQEPEQLDLALQGATRQGSLFPDNEVLTAPNGTTVIGKEVNDAVRAAQTSDNVDVGRLQTEQGLTPEKANVVMDELKARQIVDEAGNSKVRQDAPSSPPVEDLIPEVTPRARASTSKLVEATDTATGDTRVLLDTDNIDDVEDLFALAKELEGQTAPRVTQAESLEAGRARFGQGIDLEAIQRGERPLSENAAVMKSLGEKADQTIQHHLAEFKANPTQELGQRLANSLAVSGTISRMQKNLSSDIARALNIQKVGPDNKIKFLEEVENLFKARELDQGITMQDIADRISDLDTKKLREFAEIQANPSWTGAIADAWHAITLSRPDTQLTNIASNTIAMGVAIPEQFLARDVANLIKQTGAPLESLIMTNAMVNGMGDAFAAAGRTFKTGETAFGAGQKLERGTNVRAELFGLESDSLLGKAANMLGSTLGLTGKSLATADEFFKTLNYRMSLHASAHRKAFEEGLGSKSDEFSQRVAEIINNPDKFLDIHQAAMKDTEMRTFTNALLDPDADPGVLRKIANGVNTAAATSHLGSLFLPYIRTGVNTVEFAVERTPLLAGLSNRFRADIKAGGTRRAEALAKQGMGMMLGLSAWGLAEKGVITGTGPIDFRERKKWESTGWRPFSIHIPGTSLAFDYSKDTVLRSVFGTTARLHELAEGGQEDPATFGQAAWGGMSAWMSGILDSAWMKRITDQITAVNRALQNPTEKNVKRILRSSPVGIAFSPGILADLSRTLDPVQREVDGILDGLAGTTPFYSKTVNPTLDPMTGEPMLWNGDARRETLGALVEKFTPFRRWETSKDPTRVALHDAGFHVQEISNKIHVTELSKDQHHRLQQLATKPPDAPPLKETLDKLVRSQQWKDAEDNHQWRQANFDHILRAYRENARNHLLAEDRKLAEQVETDRIQAARRGTK